MALAKRHASGKPYKADTKRVRRAAAKRPEPEAPAHRAPASAKRQQRVHTDQVRKLIEGMLMPTRVAPPTAEDARARLRAWERTKLAMRWLHEEGYLRSGKGAVELAAMAVAHVKNRVD